MPEKVDEVICRPVTGLQLACHAKRGGKTVLAGKVREVELPAALIAQWSTGDITPMEVHREAKEQPRFELQADAEHKAFKYVQVGTQRVVVERMKEAPPKERVRAETWTFNVSGRLRPEATCDIIRRSKAEGDILSCRGALFA